MRAIVAISGIFAFALAASTAAAGEENGFWWVTPESGNGYATVQGGYLVGDNSFTAQLCGSTEGVYEGFYECDTGTRLAISYGEFTGWYFPQTLLYLGCGPDSSVNWTTYWAQITDNTTGNMVRVNLGSSYTDTPTFNMGCPPP